MSADKFYMSTHVSQNGIYLPRGPWLKSDDNSTGLEVSRSSFFQDRFIEFWFCQQPSGTNRLLLIESRSQLNFDNKNRWKNWCELDQVCREGLLRASFLLPTRVL